MTCLLQNFIRRLTEYDHKLEKYERRILARCFGALKSNTKAVYGNDMVEKDGELDRMIKEFQRVNTHSTLFSLHIS